MAAYSSRVPLPTSSSSRPAFSRGLSPPLSTTSSHAYASTATAPQKVNIVTRVAIEGNAKKDKEGVSVKMYLKMSLPLDSVVPGSTVPLFPEENVKILSSEVHPLDHNSSPYNFSSNTSPHLHSAARALNLPARSPYSYTSLFGSNMGNGSVMRASSVRSNGSSAQSATLDEKYTGQILVSGYTVSYVVPREFPPRMSDDELAHSSAAPYKSRRSSVSRDKYSLQLMAAIDMWVPYVCRPPRAPYLLSIPTPRCLHNHIKLRIFAPPGPSISSSQASLSSIEDDSRWDLASEPHVTRAPSANTQLADDESSEGVPGFADGCGLQGTFPSAPRLRVRWAPPQRLRGSGPTRRQVGVQDARGDVTCTVLGSAPGGGVKMRVEYSGTCTGVWFAGVATLLGLDVALVARGADVTWAPDAPPRWEVGGGMGYTGFDTGLGTPKPRKRDSLSLEPEPEPDPDRTYGAPGTRSGGASRTSSSASSSSSLMRAPLPQQSVPEYSFEGSQTSSGGPLCETISSLPSDATSNITSSMITAATGSDHNADDGKAPGSVITLHLNMNDLLPPAPGSFTFSIAGTVVVTPRVGRDAPVLLPRFTVLVAEEERTNILVVADASHAALEVYAPSGDLRDPQTRRTVLQRGGRSRCGEDGARVKVVARGEPQGTPSPLAMSRPGTPNGHAGSALLKRAPSTSSMRGPIRRDGPRVISWATATVTPLSGAYAIRVCLPAPPPSDDDQLFEFGLPRANGTGAITPRVEVAGASVGGVPVHFDATAASRETSSGVPFDETDAKEWVSWITVRRTGGEVGGEAVVVDYVVLDRDKAVSKKKKGKQKAVDGTTCVLLPSFALPVGKLEVIVETALDFEVQSLQTNLRHQQAVTSGRKLVHFAAEELFCPQLAVQYTPSPRPQILSPLTLLAYLIPLLLALLSLYYVVGLGQEFRRMNRSLEGCSAGLGGAWSEEPITRTITTTVMGGHWWGGSSSSSETLVSASASATLPMLTPPPVADDESSFENPYSILPVEHFVSLWPDFDFARTWDKIVAGLGKVWEALRRAYHYPLEPP